MIKLWEWKALGCVKTKEMDFSLTTVTNVGLHGSQDILNNLESPGTAELDEDDLMLDVDLPEDGPHGQYAGWRLQPLISAPLLLLLLPDGCRPLTPSGKAC